MRVSIIGAGYVGLVTGVGLAEVGHDVTCVDVDAGKVDSINRGQPPFHEDGLGEALARHVGTRLRAVTDLRAAVLATELTMIAVGTPLDGARIDLSHVEEAARQIGRALAAKAGHHTVVVKSTVVPGTTEDVVVPILEAASAKRAGTDFSVGVNPEFLRQGSAVADVSAPDRLVLGGLDDRSLDQMAALYAAFDGTETVLTTPRTAEMIKYTANSLLATLISFSNEIANLAASVGVDAVEVMRGVHLDRRITPILDCGQRVWPGAVSYLEAGVGFGGSCLPKDVQALVAYGEARGEPMRVLRSVLEVNQAQPAKVIDLVARNFDDLRGVPVSVLGMAFKPGTDDTRGSPAIPLTEGLLGRGAEVTVYDPVARRQVEERFGGRVAVADSLEAAVLGAAAVVLTTRSQDFAELPALLARRDDQPVVVDGRRLFDADRFERYEGIGRRSPLQPAGGPERG
jgi:UDPglucose 6-dehydrogenase/GDP-mannose 6-dehydrogenase